MTLFTRHLARPATAAALCWTTAVSAATPSDYAMPYSIAGANGDSFRGITLVDSANFDQTSQLVPASAGVGVPHVIVSGRIDDTGLHDVRPHTLVWAQGDRWMRAALRNGLTPSPVRVSSETNANAACQSDIVYRDFAAPAQSVLFYQLPGDNGTCDDGDDVVRRVDVNDDRTVAPTDVAQLKRVDLEPIYLPDGTLHAIYSRQGGTILRIASDLTTVTTVRTGVERFDVVGSLPDGTAIAVINSNLERIVPAGTIAANPLRVPKAGYRIDQALLHGSNVFFTEAAKDGAASIQTRILRVGADGTIDPALMVSLGQPAAIQGFTTQRIVYTVGTAGETDVALYSFPQGGASGDRQKLVHRATSPQTVEVFTTDSDEVFFNVTGTTFTPAPAFTSVALVKSDLGESKRNYGAHSAFLGGQITDSGAGALEQRETYERLLLGTRGNANLPGVVGGKLFSLDPGALTTAPLADLPGYLQPITAFGFGSGSIGALLNFKNEKSDVFAFDLVNVRYRLLTNSTAPSEFPDL